MTKTRYHELTNQCHEEIAWAVRHGNKTWEQAQKDRLFWLRKHERRIIDTHVIKKTEPQAGSMDSDSPFVVG